MGTSKAFTMIEMIFVIVIIGIIAAVALPKLAATRNDAKVAAMKNKIANAATEIAAYATSQGRVLNNMGQMSNAVQSMINKGEAVQTGNTLKIKMNGVSDCIKIVLVQSPEDANLTVSYGAAGGDSVCQALQQAVDASKYPVPLSGVRIVQ